MTNIKDQRKELSELASRQQRLAANPRQSVWVGASAGTGKTKVLSDRVLRLLLEGVKPEKILCLTYTKAAAVEMSSRIAEKLGFWAIYDDKKLEDELIKLYGELPDNSQKVSKLKARARQLFAVMMDTPGGLKIKTTHSFCQEVLKSFPLEAGISPYFEILDDQTSAEAVNNVKNNIINSAGNNPTSDIGQAVKFLVTHSGEYNFSQIIKKIIDNRSKIERIINQNSGTDNLLKIISQKLQITDDDKLEQIVSDFAELMPMPDLRLLVQSGIDSLCGWTDLSKKLTTDNYEDYLIIFLTQGFLPRSLSKIKNLKNDPRLATIFNDESNRCLELIEKIKSLNVYQATKSVIILASALIDGYNSFKNQHSKMDFDDIILITKKLLEDKDSARWVLFKLDGGIDDILIDEAQDTSPDQWDIIKAISDEFFCEENTKRTIFAVGDRKQSIYSFQGADPDKFDDMRNYFSSLSSNFTKVNLEVSFRSAPSILNAVNQLFKEKDIRSGVASDDENIEHIPFRVGEGGEVEFWNIIEPQKEKDDDSWNLPIQRTSAISTSSQMAKTIAAKIKNIVTSGEELKSKKRPIKYGDFLVLVRNRSGFCEEFIRECKNIGINIAGIDRIKLMQQIAVQDLVSIGKFLLFPDDDLSLAEVLKSPIFNLNDDDLFKLCYQRSGSLWSALLANSQYTQVSESLKKLFNQVDYMRPFELYNYILVEMGGRKKFYSRMGDEADDGIDEFINMCLVFEQEHIPTLQNFIDWITSNEVEIKREAEQKNSDMVRIMTVHGSKGLQAPIVILPDTTGVPECKKSGDLLFENNFFVYPTASCDYNDLCNQIKEREKIKQLEEYRRLMYVAVTRAEDRMIFCGYRKKNQSPDTSWYNLFKKTFTQIATFNQEDNLWKISNQQEFEPQNNQSATKSTVTADIPDCMYLPAVDEKPLSKPLTPSKPDDEPAVISPLITQNDEIFYKRGTIIHKLLQFIPELDTQQQKSSILEFLANKEIPAVEAQKIAQEVISLIENPQFGEVFGRDSKSEVPIIGEVNGKIISGQIDKLLVKKERVIIVDFKTNRQPADNPSKVPTVYRSQLSAYRDLLQKIYPDKKIEAFILWTNTANMMKIL